MRVLTATPATQGDRADDVCWTTAGELVALPVLECSCPDCGCDRSFTGLDSQRATTTCVVTDAPLDRAGLRREVVRSLAAAGWLVDLGPAVPDAAADDDAFSAADALSALDRELVDDVVVRIVEVADAFPPGTVLARAHGGVVVRRPAVDPASTVSG